LPLDIAIIIYCLAIIYICFDCCYIIFIFIDIAYGQIHLYFITFITFIWAFIGYYIESHTHYINNIAITYITQLCYYYFITLQHIIGFSLLFIYYITFIMPYIILSFIDIIYIILLLLILPLFILYYYCFINDTYSWHITLLLYYYWHYTLSLITLTFELNTLFSLINTFLSEGWGWGFHISADMRIHINTLHYATLDAFSFESFLGCLLATGWRPSQAEADINRLLLFCVITTLLSFSLLIDFFHIRGHFLYFHFHYCHINNIFSLIFTTYWLIYWHYFHYICYWLSSFSFSEGCHSFH